MDPWSATRAGWSGSTSGFDSRARSSLDPSSGVGYTNLTRGLRPRRTEDEAGTRSPFCTRNRINPRGAGDRGHTEPPANGSPDPDAAGTGEDAPEDAQEDQHEASTDPNVCGRGASLRSLQLGRDGRCAAGGQPGRLRHHAGSGLQHLWRPAACQPNDAGDRQAAEHADGQCVTEAAEHLHLLEMSLEDTILLSDPDAYL